MSEEYVHVFEGCWNFMVYIIYVKYLTIFGFLLDDMSSRSNYGVRGGA